MILKVTNTGWGMDKNMLPKSLHRHWQPALCFHLHDHCLSYNSWSMLQLIFVLQIHQVRNRERTAMWLFTSSHIIIDDIPYHLCWDKSFSSNRILSRIWTDENQCWQPTDLKILEEVDFSISGKTGKGVGWKQDLLDDEYLHITWKLVVVISVHLHEQNIAFILHSKLHNTSEIKNIPSW